MRLLNGKQGLRRSQFAKELKGADLEKVLIIPVDASKIVQKAMILNYFGDVVHTPFAFMVNQTGMKFLIQKIEEAKQTFQAKQIKKAHIVRRIGKCVLIIRKIIFIIMLIIHQIRKLNIFNRKFLVIRILQEYFKKNNQYFLY